MKVNLKRLLANEGTIDLIHSLADNKDFAILDAKGKPLYVSNNLSPEIISGMVIKANQTEIGRVCSNSGKAADTIARFIAYLAKLEYEKKALASETLEKYKEISLMAGLNEKLASVLHPLDVANTLIRELEKTLWADHIQIVIYNYDKERYENLAIMNKHPQPFQEGEQLAVKWLSLNMVGEIINDLAGDERFSDYFPQVSSLKTAPLIVNNSVIGGVFIFSRQFHSYTSMDLKLLNALVSQTATALEAARLYELLKDTFIRTVFTLVETLEKRDPYTGGHTKRVMEYSVKIAQTLNFSKDETEEIMLAAVLHDIGKIGICDKVLLKNTKLTDEEFTIIKNHTIYGEEILSNINSLRHLIPGVKDHHERFDGTGYPNGKKAEEIHFHARVIAVADAFDAMTSDRPYRKKMALETAIEELKLNAGRQFDPEIVEAFCQMLADSNLNGVNGQFPPCRTSTHHSPPQYGC